MMTKNDIENSKREACERAKVEGRAEGAEQKQREVAKKLKNLEVDTTTISQATGLSIEEVRAL